MSFSKEDQAQIMSKINDPSFFAQASTAVFNEADINENGFIERKELYQCLYNLAIQLGMNPPSRNDIDEQMEIHDKNKDGRLSKKEFGPIAKQMLIDILSAQYQ